MKLIKRTLGILMSLALVGAMLLPYRAWAAEETPIPTITLSVGQGQPTPEYVEGDKDQKLTLNVKNEGTADAVNVKVTPMIDDAAAWPFEISQMNNDAALDNTAIPAGKSVNASWTGLTVRSDAGSKSYKLQFTITCDVGTERFKTTKYIFVKTKAQKQQGTDNQATQDPQTQDQQPQQPQPQPQPQSPAPAPDDAAAFSNNEPVSSDGSVSTDKGFVPRVIVTGFSTDPGTVNAGNDFKLIVHLKNTSTRTAVSNMLFDLQAPASGTEGATEAPAFLPSSGSSTVYLDSIPAGGTHDISIALNARADLVQKPYSITMSMKYQDSGAAQFESSSSLAIPVKQAARFEFSDIEIAPDKVAVGEEANITCSLYNTGRIKLYNVKAKFQGQGIEGKEVFVGNVDSGATGTIDGIITASKDAGEGGKYKMVVTYEDTAGKVSTAEKEFTLTIAPEQKPMDAMAPPEPQAKKTPIIPIIIGVVIIGGIAAVVIIVKKKKKKKESLEEEDLMDEVDRFTEDE